MPPLHPAVAAVLPNTPEGWCVARLPAACFGGAGAGCLAARDSTVLEGPAPLQVGGCVVASVVPAAAAPETPPSEDCEEYEEVEEIEEIEEAEEVEEEGSENRHHQPDPQQQVRCDTAPVRLLCTAWVDPATRQPNSVASTNPLRIPLSQVVSVHPDDADCFDALVARFREIQGGGTAPTDPTPSAPPSALEATRCIHSLLSGGRCGIAGSAALPRRLSSLPAGAPQPGPSPKPRGVHSVSLSSTCPHVRRCVESVGRHSAGSVISTSLSGGYIMRSSLLFIPSLGGSFRVAGVSGPDTTRDPSVVYRVTHRTSYTITLKEASSGGAEGAALELGAPEKNEKQSILSGGGGGGCGVGGSPLLSPLLSKALLSKAPPGFAAVLQRVSAMRRVRRVREGVLLHGVSGVGKTHFADLLPELLRLEEEDERETNAEGESEEDAGIATPGVGVAAPPGSAFSRVVRIQGDTSPLSEYAGIAADIAEGGSAAYRRALVIIDSADRIDASSPSSSTAVLRHILSHLPPGCVVLSTAATPAGVSPSLRGTSGLGAELYIPPPTEADREAIAKECLRRASAGATLLKEAPPAVAAKTPGCVGGDVVAICAAALLELPAAGAPPSGEEVSRAVSRCCARHHATLRRAVCTEPPGGVTFSSIGGLHAVKEALSSSVLWAAANPEAAARFRVRADSGVLLYGPPGCAKTTLVRALAGEAKRSLLCVDAAALFACYVGESEAILRSVFAKARLVAPSIVFIDEIESVCGRRRGSSSTAGDVASTVLTTLLNELDGVDTVASTLGASAQRDVIFIGATNHPDSLDTAILRPGRLDRLVYVPPPDASERKEILRMYFAQHPVSGGVEGAVEAICADSHTKGHTGADLKALANEAAYVALRRHIASGGGGAEVVEVEGGTEISPEDVYHALGRVPPTATPAMEAQYAEFARRVGA